MDVLLLDVFLWVCLLVIEMILVGSFTIFQGEMTGVDNLIFTVHQMHWSIPYVHTQVIHLVKWRGQCLPCNAAGGQTYALKQRVRSLAF